MNIRLPSDHPLRRRLADEVHARPPVGVPAPAAISCIALLRPNLESSDGFDDFAPMQALAALHGQALSVPENPHVVIDLPGLRVKWERHSEFTSYLFARPLSPDHGTLATLPILPTAMDALPADWLATLPGQTIAAIDVALISAGGALPTAQDVAGLFSGPTLVGSMASDGAGRAFTDFTLTTDGRSRWLLVDHHLTQGQQARLVQRLVEIAIYRVMAMLAFPTSRELAVSLTRAEQRLSAITSRIADRAPADALEETMQQEDRKLLDDLTLLAAEIEKGVARCAFRFSASQAYWDIVLNRIGELRETRMPGLPTLGEFLSRRLAPAMNTVAATARRQQELSARVVRSSELLRTRVDVAREEQNQRLLAAMDRRGRLSLRLQQTVEGLSIAALTYYAVGLLGFALKPAKNIFPNFNPDWVTAAAIPLLAFVIWRSIRRIRRELEKPDR